MRRLWILYDARCPWCRMIALRLQALLAGLGCRIVPLQHRVLRRLWRDEADMLSALRCLSPTGMYSGAQALAQVAGRCWITMPLALLPRLPLVGPCCESLYQALARRRPCDERSCG